MTPEAPSQARSDTIRADLRLIAGMVEPGARVLDVGTGNGTLLDILVNERGAVGRGIELSQAGVNACVRHGLSVVQGDADTDLKDYPTRAFDYVVLSQTLQATYAPKRVLQHLVRIGTHAIVSFPNFGHWRVRADLALQGRMPRTGFLPEPWHETPNIHLCTLRDFTELADALDIRVEKALSLDATGSAKRPHSGWPANLLAEHGLFLLTHRA